MPRIKRGLNCDKKTNHFITLILQEYFYQYFR